MTPHNYEIVDCGAFCEVIFLCISPKNPLGDFFDSLSLSHQVRNPYGYRAQIFPYPSLPSHPPGFIFAYRLVIRGLACPK
jgi:hypothetical protein